METDTETIENSLIALWELMYQEMTGKKKKVYPASPERLYIAFTAAIRKHYVEHPDHFDPRQYLGDARANMKEIVKHKIINVLGSQNKA